MTKLPHSLRFRGASALAQSYPVKPIRWLNASAPGGAHDVVARGLTPAMNEFLGQPLITENMPAAAGIAAMAALTRATPDGYTIAIATSPLLTVTPFIQAKVPYDSLKDFTHVGAIGALSSVVFVHNSVPVTTFKELVDYSKANPGKFNVPVGLGAAVHLAALSLEQRTQSKWVYVPTKGGQASIMAVATGEGDFLFMGMLQTLPHVKSGRLKLLAVSSEKRDPNVPNIPTVQETPGLEGFVTGTYQGIMGPAKIPADIVNKINSEVKRILGLPDIRERLASYSTTPMPMTPQDLAKWMLTEKDKWGVVVKTSRFKID